MGRSKPQKTHNKVPGKHVRAVWNMQCMTMDRFRNFLRFYPKSERDSGLIGACRVATLLSKHEIPMVVLNACESARSDAGPEANLAQAFLASGVPFVLAMSYKLLVSGMATFFFHFYRSFLKHRRDFCQAASDGRKAMRIHRKRQAYLGIDIELQDWIVPVTYIADGIRASEFVIPGSPSTGDGADVEDQPHWEALRYNDLSFDIEVLNVETRLLDPWRCGSGPIVNIYGFSGVGKTAFLRHCQTWWMETSMFDRIFSYSFQSNRPYQPNEIVLWLAHKLQNEMLAQDPHSSLCTIQSGVSNPLSIIKLYMRTTGLGKRVLLILDDFPQMVQGDTPAIKPLPYIDQKNLSETFESLSSSHIYVIVSSISMVPFIDARPLETGKGDEILQPPRLLGDPLPKSSHYNMPGISEPLSIGFHGDASFWATLTNTDTTAALQDIVDYFADLPSLIRADILEIMNDAHRTEQSVLSLRKSLLLGRYPFSTLSEDGMRVLHSQPAYRASMEYYEKQSGLAKAVLLGLSLFTRHLGIRTDSYILRYVRCLKEAFPRYFSRLCTTTVRDHWYQDALRRMSYYFQTRSTLEAQALEVLSQTVNDLRLLGFLRPEFAYLKGKQADELEHIPIYRIHPQLSLFLRQALENEISSTIAARGYTPREVRSRLDKVFIEHHRERIESLQSAELRSPEQAITVVNHIADEHFGKFNLLGALLMWIEEDANHRDFEYPLKFFDWFLAPWPRLTSRTYYGPSILVSYIKETRERISQVCGELAKETKPEKGQSRSKVEARLPMRRQFYSALTLLLRLSNWLSHFYMVSGQPELAVAETKRSALMISTHLGPYRAVEPMLLADAYLQFLSGHFGSSRRRSQPISLDSLAPEAERELGIMDSTPGLKHEEQLAGLSYHLLQRASVATVRTFERSYGEMAAQFERLLHWSMDTDNETERQWTALTNKLMAKGWADKRATERWGYRTREEKENVEKENELLFRRTLAELAKFPQEWFDGMLQRFSAILQGLTGNAIAIPEGQSLDETLVTMAQRDDEQIPRLTSGGNELTDLYESVKRAWQDLRRGTSPDQVFDAIFPRFKTFFEYYWRRSLLQMIEFSMRYVDRTMSASLNQLLVKDYMTRRDWEGLNQYLHNLDLEKEHGGRTQFYAVQGICSLYLKNVNEAGLYLTKALRSLENREEWFFSNFAIFGFAGAFTVQVEILRLLIAVKYEAGDDSTVCPISAWLLFLDALAFGYAPSSKILYCQNGALLEQLTEHYLPYPSQTRDAMRVVELPQEEEYGCAMLHYEPSIDPDDRSVIIPDAERDLYLLIEFLYRTRIRSHVDLQFPETIYLKAMKYFVRHCERSPITRLPPDAASVLFLRALKEELVCNPAARKDTIELFEQFLMGKSVVGVPHSLITMDSCPVLPDNYEGMLDENDETALYAMFDEG